MEKGSNMEIRNCKKYVNSKSVTVNAPNCKIRKRCELDIGQCRNRVHCFMNQYKRKAPGNATVERRHVLAHRTTWRHEMFAVVSDKYITWQVAVRGKNLRLQCFFEPHFYRARQERRNNCAALTRSNNKKQNEICWMNCEYHNIFVTVRRKNTIQCSYIVSSTVLCLC